MIMCSLYFLLQMFPDEDEDEIYEQVRDMAVDFNMRNKMLTPKQLAGVYKRAMEKMKEEEVRQGM